MEKTAIEKLIDFTDKLIVKEEHKLSSFDILQKIIRKAEQLAEEEKAINDIKRDVIDEVISLYVPCGNPEVWLNKIKSLRDSVS
jgi:hypothetical protein